MQHFFTGDVRKKSTGKVGTSEVQTYEVNFVHGQHNGDKQEVSKCIHDIKTKDLESK